MLPSSYHSSLPMPCLVSDVEGVEGLLWHQFHMMYMCHSDLGEFEQTNKNVRGVKGRREVIFCSSAKCRAEGERQRKERERGRETDREKRERERGGVRI